MADTDTLTVACTVTNTGGNQEKEAVQLYVRDEASTVSRPVRELKGFEKIELAPGEAKAVSFTLDKRAFAYYEPKIHDWFVESGRFVIELGAPSRDIRLSGTVDVSGTIELPFHFTKNSVLADLSKTVKGRSFLQTMTAQLNTQNKQAAGLGIQFTVQHKKLLL